MPPRHFGTLHQCCLKFLTTTFYPLRGGKYRMEIFGHRTAKTDKKIHKENFTHPWCKVLKCWNGFKHHWRKVPQCWGGALHSAECHSGTSDQMGKIRKFWTGVFSFGTLHGEVLISWQLKIGKWKMTNGTNIWKLAKYSKHIKHTKY